MNARGLLLVGIGGAFGSMARYAISMAMSKVTAQSFPVSTFGINIAGSFIIGLLVGLYLKGSTGFSENMVLLLATGFCGGFTTFSAFALENISLMQKGQSMVAILYVTASVLCGLLLCKLGLWLTA